MSGYTVTYQMRKKKRQRRDKIAAYVLTFVAVIFAAFIIVRFLCAGYTVQGDSMYYVKRVVGLPGETVQVRDGNVYVDGRKAKSFGKEQILSPGLAADGVKLSKNQYFVMGDNYNNSEDSRSAVVGNVKKTQIIGKVGIKYWPFG